MELDDRDLYSGLIRLPVLHHASEGAVFGLGLLDELGRHGYRISGGTVYPILHGLEKKGYLRSSETREGKSLRKTLAPPLLCHPAHTAHQLHHARHIPGRQSLAKEARQRQKAK